MVHRDPKFLRDVLERWDNASRDESSHKSMDRHEDEIDQFLDVSG